ncbi:hypothetical protein ScPMuIL_001558 [Solemya velum]
MPTASQARIMMGSSANLQKRICTTVTCFPIAKISTPGKNGYGNSGYCYNNTKFDNLTTSKNPFVIPARRQTQLLSRGNDSPRTVSFHQELDINGHDGILSFDRKSRTFRWLISSSSAHDILVTEKKSEMSAELSEHDYEKDETPPCPSPSRFDSPVSIDDYDENVLESNTYYFKTENPSSANARKGRKRAHTAPPSLIRTPLLKPQLEEAPPGGVPLSNRALVTVNRTALRKKYRETKDILIPSFGFSSRDVPGVETKVLETKETPVHERVQEVEEPQCLDVATITDSPTHNETTQETYFENCSPTHVEKHLSRHCSRLLPETETETQSGCLAVCFNIDGSDSHSLSHRDVKDIIEEQTGVKVKYMQYDPVGMRLPDSLTRARWVTTLFNAEDQEFLASRGLTWNDTYIVIHKYDDTFLHNDRVSRDIHKEVKWLNNFQKKTQKGEGKSVYNFEKFKEHISNFL